MPASAFRASLSEDAGTRSGFALTERDMLDHLGAEHWLTEQLLRDDFIRVASDSYADTVGDLLHALGAAEEPGMPPLSIRLMRRLGGDWRELFTLDEMMTLEAVASQYLRRRNQGDPQQAELYTELTELVGPRRSATVLEPLCEAMEIHLAQSPQFTREVDIDGQVALDDLFRSERLPIDEGKFFDQRFINYLAAQPGRLGDMHWRQFEGMTAEWFQRRGYTVELGRGRGDGGVDLRLWHADSEPGAPPAIIVQCKRQRSRVERVIVKALYADVDHENADAGLIVTTSDLSPGAADDIKARAYPITTANRAEVSRWIHAMREPASGTILDIDATDAEP